MQENHYPRLLLMVLLSFAAMYVLMYAMVDSFGSVYNNVNQAYMAALMAAPMLAIELIVMSSMYHDRRKNAALIGGAILVGVLAFVAIRQQTVIGDRQFLRSMIPHHSGAILMCSEATIEDARIKALCKAIIESQRAEIAQMKALLEE